MNNGVN